MVLPLDVLAKLRQKSPLIWLGLMSGTSGDGIDVVRAEVRSQGESSPSVTLLEARTVPFPKSLQADLRHDLDAATRFLERVGQSPWGSAGLDAEARDFLVDVLLSDGTLPSFQALGELASLTEGAGHGERSRLQLRFYLQSQFNIS